MACWLPLWPSAHSGGATLGNLDQTVTLPSSKPPNPRVLTLVGRPYSCGLCSLLQPHFQSLFALVTGSSCSNLHAVPQALPGRPRTCLCWGSCTGSPSPGVSLTQVCLQVSHRPGQASPTAEPAGPLCFSAPQPTLLFTVLVLSHCPAFSLTGCLPLCSVGLRVALLAAVSLPPR